MSLVEIADQQCLFDFIEKRNTESIKILDNLLNVLGQRADIEDRYNKQIEKFSQIGIPAIQDEELKGYEVFFQIIYKDANDRVASSQKFVNQLKQQVESYKEILKKDTYNLKKGKDDIWAQEKTCNENFKLLVNNKDKYYKSSREFEELSLQLAALEINLDSKQKDKQDILTKIAKLYNQIQEQEHQYKVQINLHSTMSKNLSEALKNINTNTIQSEQQRGVMFKELLWNFLYFEEQNFQEGIQQVGQLKQNLSEQSLQISQKQNYRCENTVANNNNTANNNQINQNAQNKDTANSLCQKHDKDYYHGQKYHQYSSFQTEITNKIINIHKDSIQSMTIKPNKDKEITSHVSFYSKNKQVEETINVDKDSFENQVLTQEMKNYLHPFCEVQFNFYDTNIPDFWQEKIEEGDPKVRPRKDADINLEEAMQQLMTSLKPIQQKAATSQANFNKQMETSQKDQDNNFSIRSKSPFKQQQQQNQEALDQEEQQKVVQQQNMIENLDKDEETKQNSNDQQIENITNDNEKSNNYQNTETSDIQNQVNCSRQKEIEEKTITSQNQNIDPQQGEMKNVQEIGEYKQQQQQQQEENEEQKSKELQFQKLQSITDPQQENYLKQKESLKSIFPQNIIGKIEFMTELFYIYTHPKIVSSINEAQAQQLEQLIKQKFYFQIILYIYQTYRTFKRENLSLVGYANIKKLTQIVLTKCNEKKDIQITRKLMLMCFTIYKLDPQKPNEKIYLQEEIRKHNIWKTSDIWEAMIYDSIEEVLTSMNVNFKNQTNNINEKLFQQKNLIHSNLLSIANSMIKFKIEKQSVKNLLSRYAQYFGLFPMQIQELLQIIDFDPKTNNQFPTGVSSLSMLHTLFNNQPEQNKPQINPPVTNENIQRRVFTFAGSKPIGPSNNTQNINQQKK